MATEDRMLIDGEDEDYASDQDSDFAPDADGAAGPQDGSDSDSDNDDADVDPSSTVKESTSAGSAAANRKRPDDDDAADGDFENSGDEAIIQKGHKKQKKEKAKAKAKRKDGVDEDDDDDDDDDGDDDGGEGGLIKTRSMRAAEKLERRSRGVVPSGPVTVDVDDLWARMTAGPILPGKQAAEAADGSTRIETNKNNDGAGQDGDSSNGLATEEGDGKASNDKKNPKSTGKRERPAMIKIKRTYNFAGKVHTEEKLVARDSAEAKLYIASLDPKSAEYIALTTAGSDNEESNAAEDDEEDPSQQLRKPRKAFRSIFEPVVAGTTTTIDPATGQPHQHQQQLRTDLNLKLSAALQMREAAFRNGGGKSKKLNVVEKSRMDWAGFVDKEGIKDELELAGRSKESYAHRQDFLSRVEANREDEARRARLAGRG